jgi:hypothetical protein
MPVMPSFGNFAATPNLAESYLGGARVVQQDQQAAQQFELEAAKIAAGRQQAAMEAQARQQALQQKSIQDQQELELQRSYKESMLGLQEREMKAKEDQFNQQIQQAAQAHEATQAYQQEAADMIGRGQEPTSAFMQSAMKYGPQMNLPSGAYSQMFRDRGEAGAAGTPEGMPEDFGEVTDVPGMEGYSKFRTGKGSYQLLKKPDTGEASQQPDIPPGYLVFNEKVLPDVAFREQLKERNRLVKMEESDIPFANAAAKREAGDKLSKTDKIALKKGDERQAKIGQLSSEIEGRMSGGGGRGARGAEGPAPDKKMIQYLQDNPDTADQFDEFFGEGASQQYLE